MNYQVEVCKQAEENLEHIAQYLEDNWSSKAKTDFLLQISEHLQLLEIMPFMNRKSVKYSSLRECVVNRNTILYYRISDDLVEVITIQNSKKDLDNLDF